MKRRVLMLLSEIGIAVLLMWFDMRVSWLYFFAVVLWSFSHVLAAITANNIELRVLLETIQNRVGAVPGVDAAVLVQKMRDNTSEKDWKQFCEMFNFARPRD
jgi:hypothetical protein